MGLSQFDDGDEASPPRAPTEAPIPAYEAQRLAALRKLEPYAKHDDPVLVSVACQAAGLCDTEVGFVSLLGDYEERFVACVGIDIRHAERSVSFCAHAILEPDVTVVEDTHADPRFRENPFVVNPPHIRFYVGAPIHTSDDVPIGTVCVVDFAPREADSKCLAGMKSLAAITAAILETRRLFTAFRSREMSPESLEVARARLDELLLTMVAPRAV